MTGFELDMTLEECRTARSIAPLVALLRRGHKLTPEERELIDAIPFGALTPAQWVEYQARAVVLNRKLRDDGMKPGPRRAEVFKRFPLVTSAQLDTPSPAVRARAAKV